jgi:predicted Zn-dependent peptidase
MRTLRQLLGPWQKGTRTVPATFRQPSPPDARVLAIDQPGAAKAELRLAVRGLARSDRDTTSASLLALIVRERLRASSIDLSNVFARHEAHDLPGMFLLSASVPTALASKTVSAAQDVMKSLAKIGPTAVELESARAEMLAELSRQSSREDLSEYTADNWLSMEIYKLQPVATQVQSLTLADLQRVASRLFKDAAAATVVVGDADQLKRSFGAVMEVRGAKPNAKTTADPLPGKKP